jgi:hypothetical protein
MQQHTLTHAHKHKAQHAIRITGSLQLTYTCLEYTPPVARSPSCKYMTCAWGMQLARWRRLTLKIASLTECVPASHVITSIASDTAAPDTDKLKRRKPRQRRTAAHPPEFLTVTLTRNTGPSPCRLACSFTHEPGVELTGTSHVTQTFVTTQMLFRTRHIERRGFSHHLRRSRWTWS